MTRGSIVLALMAAGASSAAWGQATDPTQSSGASATLRACIEKDENSLSADELRRCFKIMKSYNSALAKKTTQRPKAPASRPAVVKADAPSDRSNPASGAEAVAASEDPKCLTQSFFLRRDRTDVFSFLNPCGPSDVPGATIKYTNDRLAHSQNLNVQALTGYTLIRNGASYALTPSVYMSGVLAEPFKPSERNVARAALDNEFGISGSLFLHEIDIAPYVQTDFRGKGHIAGLDATWEPYNLLLHLGGRDDEQRRRLIGFYWRLQGEADVFRIENAGLTNYLSHTDHAFLGGTIQTRMVLLQNMREVGEFLCGRIYVSGTAQGFWDAEASHRISNFTSEVGYFLGSGVAPYWRYCAPPTADGKLPPLTPSATSSSISFVYTNGTDKINLVNQRQYKVQLNFRY